MNPDEIVRWAHAAFVTSPEASYDQVVDIVRAAGVPNAERACAMLVLAFGRRVLEGLVALPATYAIAGGGERALADEPLYVAADRLAHHAPGDHIKLIGLRSAEVNAVDQALHAGSQPENLVLSPPVIDVADAPPSGGAAPFDAQAALDQLVRAHAGAALRLEARVWPRRLQAGLAMLSLDAVVQVGDRELAESHVGMGNDIAAATRLAIDKLARASLHVLLAALGDRALGEGQVEWERRGEFDVCSGPLLVQLAQPPPIAFAAIVDRALAALAAQGLSRELHWLRLFVAVQDGAPSSAEALLDNEAWPAGEAILRDHAWPAHDQMYTLRHFLVLVPRP